MGRKGSRYSWEEKLFYIGLIKDGVSTSSIHREYGVHHSQVAQWVMQYDANGPEALNNCRHQRIYPEEFMLEVVKHTRQAIFHIHSWPDNTVFRTIPLSIGGLTGLLVVNHLEPLGGSPR